MQTMSIKNKQLDFIPRRSLKCNLSSNFKDYFFCYKLNFVSFKFIDEKLRYGHFIEGVRKALGPLESNVVTIQFVNMIYIKRMIKWRVNMVKSLYKNKW